MKSCFGKIIALTAFALFAYSTASAQTATPTATATATATATPQPCTAAQLCIQSGVASTITSCVDSNSCVPTGGSNNYPKTDRFATSAQDLASRSIAQHRCSNRKRRFACNACYENSKSPLANRFDGILFHGMLGQAIHLIEVERKSVCLKLKP